MNFSPSPSPRRMLRPRPVSPLAPQPRENDEYDDRVSATPSGDHGRGDDRGGFYHISLSDGAAHSTRHAGDPLSPPSYQNQQQQQQRSHYHTHSYSQSYGRDDNYGYSPSYGSSSSNSRSKLSDTGAIRPVQEYHNAFANVDAPYAAPSDSASALPPPPSASTSSPSSPFASFSSASRAFLEHRRQQSIPNLLPSITSIGRNLGRAISPDRSLKSSPSSRPPIPVYKDDRAGGEDSASSDEYSSDDSGSDDEEDRRNMAPFTGDSRAAATTTTTRANTYTTYKSSRNQNDTSSVAAGFTNWLSGGGGATKAPNSDRTSFISSSRAATPEPSNLASRGGMMGVSNPAARRSMSLTSDASATPRGSVTATSSTSPSRFSQLATSMTATLSRLTQQQSPVSPRAIAVGGSAGFENDEFYNLDVEAALFPAGQSSDRDAFSPSAYKNLEANATGALRQMQAAYRQRSVALRELVAEKGARDEELEEAETRAQHLKMQLEGMARRAADQQREMQILMDELAAEKKARAQERAMLLSAVPATPTASAVAAGAEGSVRDRDDDQATSTILSEDLGVEEAQRDQKRRNDWRRRSLKSDGSSYDDTDEGEEESAVDEDESSSSVFSRSRSPTFTPSINFSLDNAAGDGQPQAPHPRVAALGSTKQTRSVSSSSTATVVSQQPLSTFQKLMKNVTSAIKDEEPDGLGRGTTNCRNCRGQDVSFAWNTVSVLRDENKHLKQRVGQLEVAVEGALDMVNGVGLD